MASVISVADLDGKLRMLASRGRTGRRSRNCRIGEQRILHLPIAQIDIGSISLKLLQVSP